MTLVFPGYIHVFLLLLFLLLLLFVGAFWVGVGKIHFASKSSSDIVKLRFLYPIQAEWNIPL